MSSENIDATLKGLFNTEFPQKISGVLFFFENLPKKQPSVPYVVVSVTDLHTCRENIGNVKQFEKVGVVNISIHVPEDTGTKKLKQIVDAIEKVLIDRQIAIPGGGQITLYDSETRNRGSLSGFYNATIATSYRANVIISR